MHVNSVSSREYASKVTKKHKSIHRGAYLCSPCFRGRNCVFRRRNPEKVPPQALGLDRQPVRQTRTLTPNPNPNLNLNHNHNPIREMHMTNVSLIYITIEVTFPAIT